MNKFYYKVYGLIIESEIILSELVEEYNDTEMKVNVHIRLGEMPEIIKKSIEKGKVRDFSKNECWFIIKNVGIYRIINGNEIVIECISDDIQGIKAFLLGSAFGCIFIQRNLVAVHGSAILIKDKGVIITGHMGAGKSTLTSAFRTKGYRFLADDIAVTYMDENNNIKVHSAYPQQKLCKDAAIKLGLEIKDLKFIDEEREKFLIPSKEDFVNSSKRLYSIYEIFISKDNDVAVEEILGIKKLERIMCNIYRSGIARTIGIKGIYFRNLIKMAEQIKYYQVLRPKNLFTVDEQMNLIMSTINS
ncbi:MAG: hypothetical protein K0R54_4327 [Clostridiaceae bacterium]|jgi:hypothetical protein|nr:hypothetical protein [Clostridiaceae bacterium]